MTSLSHQPPAVRPLGARSSQDWSRELRQAIRDPHELCQELSLSSDLADKIVHISPNFPLLVPRPYLKRIQLGNPLDPLLLQVLPQPPELEAHEGFSSDPVGDSAAKRLPGLLQKYHGRALLITSPTCAINCRYCFRKDYPYESTPKGIKAWEPTLRQIAEDTSLSEVILSGGDPLMLVDGVLSQLFKKIELIPHIKRLRIHTRLPVVIPSRITTGFADLLKKTRLRTVMVLHCNHTNEIDQEVANALQQVSSTGTLLFNQSVLLKGVNDSVTELSHLSERLVDVGVTPYYLHQLDQVTGTAHFQTSLELGTQLIAEMRKRLPGYMVPRYVVEEAGQPHKTLLA